MVSLRALHNRQKVHYSISLKLLAVHDAWRDALLIRGVGTGRLLRERRTSSCGSLMSVCCPCDSCSLAAACWFRFSLDTISFLLFSSWWLELCAPLCSGSRLLWLPFKGPLVYDTICLFFLWFISDLTSSFSSVHSSSVHGTSSIVFLKSRFLSTS